MAKLLTDPIVDVSDEKTPDQPSNSPKKSYHKRSQSTADKSFVIENMSPRKSKEIKGKQMWNAVQSRKELDKKIQAIQNRIKHLEKEETKAKKVIEMSNKRQGERKNVRGNHENHVQLKIDTKIKRDKDLEAKKQRISIENENRKNKLNETKNNLLQRNLTAKQKIKQQQETNENLTRSFMEKVKSENKEKAQLMYKAEKMTKHKRSLSARLDFQSKEINYIQKLEYEQKTQELQEGELERLEKMEEEIIERLKYTKCLERETLSKELSSSMVISRPFMTPTKLDDPLMNTQRIFFKQSPKSSILKKSI
ncbi:unnamed protein product [Blepharisma stoltei]|uniref:Uncharacterized protein n=1 Tax=Blepharisma stoltei TaxID=1481888 RepID=A0AAU9K9W0_9CILI|nr:unnamed protein product [Blepharisma stoltei]